MTTGLDARPALNPGLTAILRGQVACLNRDFGRQGWVVRPSDAPAGWLYATWAARPGVTWHAATARGLREVIGGVLAGADAGGDTARLLAGWPP